MNWDWVAPTAYMGDVVLWYDGHTTDAHAFTALITRAGTNGMIDVWVIAPSAYNGFPKSCVRHADDPNRTAITTAEDGIWTHTKRNQVKGKNV